VRSFFVCLSHDAGGSYLLELAETLSKKLKQAKLGMEEMRETFQGLTESLSKENIRSWGRLAEEAMAKRGAALNIYQVQQAKGFGSEFISQIRRLTIWDSAISGRNPAKADSE